MPKSKSLVPAPHVSIIVPCYNVDKYIDQCINSIICQTLQNIEIICVDDGSTDNTGQILDGYARLDGRIKVIHQKNGGYGKAMNAGLDAAKGEYIGIIESDDLCDPEMFATLYGICSRYNLDVAKSNFYYYWSDNRPDEMVRLFPPNQYGHIISPCDVPELTYVMPSIWSGIYKRRMIEDHEIRFTETPGASYQDTAFAHKIWCSARSVWLVDQAFYWYRQDNESSSVHSAGKVYCVCTEYDEAVAFAKKWNPQMLPYLERCRYGAYRWNFSRLGKRFRLPFALRMRQDFKKALKDGHVKRELYSPEQYAMYTSIASFPRMSQISTIVKKFLG